MNQLDQEGGEPVDQEPWDSEGFPQLLLNCPLRAAVEKMRCQNRRVNPQSDSTPSTSPPLPGDGITELLDVTSAGAPPTQVGYKLARRHHPWRCKTWPTAGGRAGLQPWKKTPGNTMALCLSPFPDSLGVGRPTRLARHGSGTPASSSAPHPASSRAGSTG